MEFGKYQKDFMSIGCQALENANLNSENFTAFLTRFVD